MRKSLFATPFLLFVLHYSTFSQDSNFKFSGYVDGYYSFDFSRPNETVRDELTWDLSQSRERLYVTQYSQHNVFNINHAWLGAQYENDRVRSEFALQLGTFPMINYAHEPSPLYRLIHRANVGVKVGESSWFDAGVMGGHFGYESVLAFERELLSPALATEYTPYYQTGIQYTWGGIEMVEIRAVVLNGWQIMAETNWQKSLGMAVDIHPSDYLTLSYGNYYGNEKDMSNPNVIGPNVIRTHHNFYLAYQKDKYKFAAIGDITDQKWEDVKQKTRFFTTIASYQVLEKVGVAGRYEYAYDPDALLIEPVNLHTDFDMHVMSLALDYQPQSNCSFKLESKAYTGKNRNFRGENGEGHGALVLTAGIAVRLE